MEHIKVLFDGAEYGGLVKLAERDLRPLPDEVRAIVRDRLRRAGLLTEAATSERKETRRCER